MNAKNTEAWIKVGYDIFAHEGKSGLKVERIAKAVGKSKSSFYHHFADVDLFIDELLRTHLEQSRVIAEKERQAQSVDPDLVHVMLEHRTDLLFNRQLRIHQHVKLFADTLAASNHLVGAAFVEVWVKDLNLQLSAKQIEGIFSLAVENFYLQINPENLTYDWLSAYFKNLKSIAQNFV